MRAVMKRTDQPDPAHRVNKAVADYPYLNQTPIRPATMKAIVHRSYGSADVLECDTLDLPKIGKKEVLIEVHAAALDRGTWHLMTGTPYIIRVLGYGLTKPKQVVPGLDVAGLVCEVGSEVTQFTPGDPVYGIASGSFAEYAVANEEKLITKPSTLSFEHAAAVTVSGITALEALTDVGNIKAGQHVLVVGASGGVGTYAVQLAKALRAQVTGVASESKAELVRSLGADHVIDYRTNDLFDGRQQYDLIIDIGGRYRVSSLRAMLKQRGTLVLVGGEGGNKVTGGIGRQIMASLMSPFVKQSLKMFVSAESQTLMNRLSVFIQSGEVTPAVGQRYALDDVPVAMRELEAGNAQGKTIVVVRESP